MKNYTKIILCLLFLLGWSAEGMAQLEENRYEFWREDAKVTYDMFLDTTTEWKQEREKNFKNVLSTGLWGQLDIPKKKKDWKYKKEKAYFCAAMDKTESTLIEKSSLSLDHAKLLWDICELSTRVARKSLADSIHKMDSIGYHTKISSKGIKVYEHDTLNRIKSTGLICLFYSTALNNGKEFGRTMTSSFLREVVIPEDHYLYQEYRKTIDKMLEILKEYATTEEEIQRFVTKTPQPGYIESPFFIDDRELRGTIRY